MVLKTLDKSTEHGAVKRIKKHGRLPEPCGLPTMATIMLRKYRSLFETSNEPGCKYLRVMNHKTAERTLTGEESIKIIELIKELRDAA
jgi:hypothetical protein